MKRKNPYFAGGVALGMLFGVAAGNLVFGLLIGVAIGLGVRSVNIKRDNDKK